MKDLNKIIIKFYEKIGVFEMHKELDKPKYLKK